MSGGGEGGLLLATDLDGTFAHGSLDVRARLVEQLTARAARLVYVTGRTPEGARELAVRASLPEPDLLIADVGTSVLRGLGPARVEPIEAELDRLWPGADAVRERLAGLDDLAPQDVRAPRRVSYWVEAVRRRSPAPAGPDADPFAARDPDHASMDEEAAGVAGAVAERAAARLRGLGVDVVVSANVFLDVLPRGVNKGSTLRRVLRWLDVADEACVVAGDSLNDLTLFETGIRGIAVGNSEPALRRRVARLAAVYQAAAEGVEGVVEGLRHHGHLSGESEGGNAHGE